MITAELTDALTEVERSPQGPEQVRAAERAVLLADEIGDPEGILQARIALASSRNHVPGDPGDLALIGWLLAQLDTEVPTPRDRWHILWFGKWAMERVINIPEVSLDAAHRMLDDVAGRIRAEGYSERPVAQQRTRLSLLAGTDDDVTHWLGRWQAAPRDDLADCLACEASLLGEIAAADGEHADALDTWQPVLSGEATCAEQPHQVLSEAIDSLMAIGQVDDAVAAHRRGWRLTKGDPAYAVSLAKQLMFDVRAGYTAEAVDRLLPLLDWPEQLPLPSDRMYFCGIAAAVLDAGSRIGATPDTIDGRPTNDLIDELRGTADDIAARFDRRNGTTVVSRRLAAAVDPTPYSVPVMITGLIADRERTAAVDGETDPPVLAGRLRDILARGGDGSAIVDGWRRRRGDHDHDTGPDRDHGGPDHDRGRDLDPDTRELLRARAYLDRQLGQHLGAEEPATARGVLETARATAVRVGDDQEAFLSELALLGLDQPPAAERLDRAHRGIDEMVASGSSETAAKGLLILAGCTDPEHRSAVLSRAAELFDVAGDHGWALVARVDALQSGIGRTVDLAEADERLQTLQADAERGGHDLAVVQALAARAAGAGMTDPAAAVALYRQAEDRATTAGVRFPAAARYGLTTALLDAEAWTEARDAAQQLITTATRDREPMPRAYGSWLLAIAEQQLGNPTGAAELIEVALPALRRIEGAPLGRALWQLGSALAELGEPGAEAAYAEAADVAAAAGADGPALQARYHAGREAWRHDHDDLAREHFDRVIERAPAVGELDLYIAAVRMRANVIAGTALAEAVGSLRALPERVAELAEQQGSAGDLDRTLLEADIARHVAELYAEQGEWEPAFAELDRAEELLGDRFDARLEVRADRGRYLADAGRVDEAAAVLADVLPQLDRSLRPPATVALCNALAFSDRVDEAEAAWQRYLGDESA